MEHKNILSWFFHTARERGLNPCFHYKRGVEWKTLNWDEVVLLVHQYAQGLNALGVKEGTPVALMSSTRMEWTLLDLAILASGGITVPIYTNLPDDQVSFIVNDSAAEIAIVEDDATLIRLKESTQGGHAKYREIIQIDGGGQPKGTMALHTLTERGNQCPPERIDQLIDSIDLDRPASYVYTSGTTGIQKGAIITHGNILAEIVGATKIFLFEPEEVCLVCLPFAHVLGRMEQFYLLTKGCQSAYAESLDKLAKNYREVRPHFVVGVPRMLEKAMERVEATVETQPAFKKKIFYWAKRVGIQVAEARQRKRPIGGWLSIKHAIADKLVFKKLRDRMGGRLRSFICGGAPLAKDVAKFFTAAGVQVIEGYGLTETFAAMTANRDDDFHFGTVGKPLEGVEIKLAGDGEIMVRGPIVFKGYLNRPDATAEAFEDGWFKTGDIGEFSREGFLRITDRKKDIIVTAGGKNIAPQRIEGIMMESPYINQVMVYGDSRKYLTALVTLNYDAIKDYAKQEGIAYTNVRDLADNPTVRDLIDNIIKEKNRKLARFETIKRFAILRHEFTTETGEITPTLKVRRKFVTQKYSELLENMYVD